MIQSYLWILFHFFTLAILIGRLMNTVIYPNIRSELSISRSKVFMYLETVTCINKKSTNMNNATNQRINFEELDGTTVFSIIHHLL